MIRYESSDTSVSLEELALRRHIAEELLSVYEARTDAPEFLEELAVSVTSLCRHRLGFRAIPDEFLSLLAAKALWAAGERAAATSMLGRCGRGDEDRALLSSLYASTGGPSLELCLLMAGGVVRPSRCSLSVDGPVWSLDLSRPLWDVGAPRLELSINRQLHTILGHLSEAWSASNGLGALHLKGWRGLGDWVRSGLRREILLDSRAFLAREAKKRGWEHVPDVFDGFPRACR